MKPKELREKTKQELTDILQEFRKKMQGSRFQATSGKLKNMREIRSAKRDIARILTIIKEKSL